MPYGNLKQQRIQRFEKYEDLKKYNCTIEEMEEYEPHLNIGNIVYAGVDYQAILEQAEKEGWKVENIKIKIIVTDNLNKFVFPTLSVDTLFIKPLRVFSRLLILT